MPEDWKAEAIRLENTVNDSEDNPKMELTDLTSQWIRKMVHWLKYGV
jgi:hypothetical protein